MHQGARKVLQALAVLVMHQKLCPEMKAMNAKVILLWAKLTISTMFCHSETPTCQEHSISVVPYS